MYKTRGKPEDPWNKAAAEQEKDLAETIQVNQIQRNGGDQHLQKFLWSPTARQKELVRRQNNYDQFKMIYQNKLRRSSTGSQSLKDASEGNRNKHNPVKRNINRAQTSIPNNYHGKVCHKSAILKAPLTTMKTVNVQVPAPYKETAIFSPPKLGSTVQTLPFLRKLKKIEKLEEKLLENNKGDIDESIQIDFLKELQDANIEVDVGNAQLEEINKILEASRSQHNGKIWNVVRSLGCVKEVEFSQEYQTKDKILNKDSNIKEKTQKEQSLSKKNRLLITLNDVNQRIQRMQAKFFSDNRPQYRSVKTRNFIRSNCTSDNNLEILYKNRNYDSSCDNRKLISDDLKLQTDTKKLRNDTLIKGIVQDDLRNAETVNHCQSQTLNNTHKNLPEVNCGVPHLNLNNNDHLTKEFINQITSPISYDTPQSPIMFDTNEKLEQENCFKVPENTDKNCDEDITTESVFQSKLQESILKSDFLMKEFDINPRDMCFDISKISSILENKTSNREKSPLPENIIQRMKNERIAGDYAKARNRKLYTPTAHYMLKDTLYCTE